MPPPLPRPRRLRRVARAGPPLSVSWAIGAVEELASLGAQVATVKPT